MRMRRIGFLLAGVALNFLATNAFAAIASSCINCHGNAARMQELGAEGMYLDPAQVAAEVGMQGKPACTDCHLGDAAAPDKASAHRGMLTPFVIAAGKQLKGEALSRSAAGALTPLVPQGEGMAAMIPKGNAEALNAAGAAKIVGIAWHDRDRQTLAYSPALAEQTCGKCHSQAVQDYNASTKGLLKHQRAYRSWAEPLPGPQNCGMWFGQNFARLKAETAAPYTEAMNAASDRSCNLCHPGCNDCHYRPFAGKGRHAFGQPDTASCYGGGRGSICHAGPMDRRRGAGFMRGAYSFPDTLPTGVHVTAGLICLDCHQATQHNFGHLAAATTRASCTTCHEQIVQAVASSPHRNVDCTACHITVSGAYQYTFWGQGNTFGVETPYGKHKEYYGTRDLPTLIRNPSGRWIPVKPYPMAVLNQTRTLAPGKLQFRAIPQRSIPGNPAIAEPPTFNVHRTTGDVNDAYIAVGTRNDLPSGNKAILWIQMDKLSHAMGKARTCGTCHDSHAQVSKSEWSFYEQKDVKEPFAGSYTVTADRNGIRFTDVTWEEPVLAANRKLEDIAPFIVLPTTAWDVKGSDFSLPFNDQKTATERRQLDAFLAELERRPTEPQLLQIRGVAFHNLEMAQQMLQRAAE